MSKMLRATTTHIYRTDELLGKGASCHVYKGVHKISGKERALKIFDVVFSSNMNDVLMREVDALKRLSHANVVTFLSVEKEVSTGHQVLVMELCTGGTLLTVLSEPRYAFGLYEDEFLLLLACLVSGLKHLRHHGFVHRDIKPGNILRSIGPDGKSVYKLSDFGSAKQLQLQEEQFVSLCGTEEYLHPDIFEKAFIDRSVAKSFTSAVDVWSIGATLYHSATGAVPFRPYGGRRNRSTMFEMIGQKESGVISGVQDSPTGDIIWSKELPLTSPLSKSLQSSITYMCAGMLENNRSRIWTYETFFFETEKILSKIPVHAFSTADISNYILYFNPNDRFESLQREVELQLNIPKENQIFFLGETPLDNQVTLSTDIQDFPHTTVYKPIIVFTSSSLESQKLPPVPTSDFPEITPSMRSLDEDCRCVKASLCTQCGQQRIITECRLGQTFLCHGAVSMSLYTRKETQQLDDCIRRERHNVGLLLQLVKLSEKRYKDEEKDLETYDFVNIQPSMVGNLGKLHTINKGVEQVMDMFKVIDDQCQTIQEDYSDDTPCEKTIENIYKLKLVCPNDCECVSKPKWLFEELQKLRHKFEERKRHGRLNYHEEQLHNFDRQTLHRLCEESVKMLTDHSLPKSEEVFNNFRSWHKVYMRRFLTLKDVNEKFKEAKKLISTCQEEFQKLSADNLSPSPVPKQVKSKPISANKKKRRERLLEIHRLLNSTKPSKTQEALRQEMTSLQESVHSMKESLKTDVEAELLPFEGILQL